MSILFATTVSQCPCVTHAASYVVGMGNGDVGCLQLNAHRAQLAHIELLQSLNSQDISLCMIQEPYVPMGQLVTKPQGMDVFPAGRQRLPPRTNIYASKQLRARELSHLQNRDCTAVLLTCGVSNIVVASVYLDITLTVSPPWLLLGIDTNSHSHLFGPDTNKRGRDLEYLLFTHHLAVENVGAVPTFQTSARQSCIDATLSRGLPPGMVQGWRVDTHYNGSDHNSIRFNLAMGPERIPPTRPWAKADWGLFQRLLGSQTIYTPHSMTPKKLDNMVAKLLASINLALDQVCPLTPGHAHDRNNPWFTDWMANLKQRVKRSYQPVSYTHLTLPTIYSV